jgi:hypothetical protein
MGHYITAEILAAVSHNLVLGETILDCSEAELEILPQDAKQKLALVQMGLSMAIEALHSEELTPWLDGETGNTLSVSAR